jgi:hypothetical protein
MSASSRPAIRPWRRFWTLRLLRLLVRCEPRVIRGSFLGRKAITQRIDMRRYAAQQRAALAAHHPEWRELAGLLAWPGHAGATCSIVRSLFREWLAESGAVIGAIPTQH